MSSMQPTFGAGRRSTGLRVIRGGGQTGSRRGEEAQRKEPAAARTSRGHPLREQAVLEQLVAELVDPSRSVAERLPAAKRLSGLAPSEPMLCLVLSDLMYKGRNPWRRLMGRVVRAFPPYQETKSWKQVARAIRSFVTRFPGEKDNCRILAAHALRQVPRLGKRAEKIIAAHCPQS